jgi:glycogen synthase
VRILVYSNTYHPAIGGQETVAKLLVSALVRRGHQVSVLCECAGPDIVEDVAVFRSPPLRKRLNLVRSCDRQIIVGASLKGALPSLLLRSQPIIWHQTWLPASEPVYTAALRRLLLRLSLNVAPSQALANRVSRRTVVINNAYDSGVFESGENGVPRHDLLFVGRLVSDKGVTLLLDALAELRRRNLTPSLSIVGAGPEADPLRDRVNSLGLNDRVRFLGSKSGLELAAVYQTHKILVVPSVWAEPFGIVALEGMACGCIVIGSNAGGLPEAIGSCGLTFKPLDPIDLANQIELVLSDRLGPREFETAAQSHLARHTPDAIARRFEQLFDSRAFEYGVA